MKVVKGGLFRHFDSKQIKSEIDEELRFHLELLTQEHLQRDLSLADAKDAALRRFGNVEQVREQCEEISRRNHPAIRALKSSLILIVLSGVLVRILSTEPHVSHAGDVLIAVGVLGRFLVYLRGLSPASFHSRPDTTSPLMLYEPPQTSITVLDQHNRTPVERVIFDK
jgi:hypothetical protein